MTEAYTVRLGFERSLGRHRLVRDCRYLDFAMALERAKDEAEKDRREVRIYGAAGRLVIIVRASAGEGSLEFYPVEMRGPEALVFGLAHVRAS